MITVSTDFNAQAASNFNTTNSNFTPPPFLSFASHNVQSFTNTVKQHSLIEHYLLSNIDAIGLQETNFLHQNIRPFNKEHTSKFVASSVPINYRIKQALE